MSFIKIYFFLDITMSILVQTKLRQYKLNIMYGYEVNQEYYPHNACQPCRYSGGCTPRGVAAGALVNSWHRSVSRSRRASLARTAHCMRCVLSRPPLSVRSARCASAVATRDHNAQELCGLLAMNPRTYYCACLWNHYVLLSSATRRVLFSDCCVTIPCMLFVSVVCIQLCVFKWTNDPLHDLLQNFQV